MYSGPLAVWQVWYNACCTWNKAWLDFYFAMTDYPGARAKKKDSGKKNPV